MLLQMVYLLLLRLPLLFLSSGDELLVTAKRLPASPSQKGCKHSPFPQFNGSKVAFANDYISIRRQADECVNPGYVICPDFPTRCAPPGSYCCNDVYSCKDDQNCVGNDECCPKVAETCGGNLCCKPDSICCNNSEWCCISGASCCDDPDIQCCPENYACCPQALGCCADNEICCPGGCCPDGTTCYGDGWCEYFESTLSQEQTPPEETQPVEGTETLDFPTPTSSTATATETPDFPTPTSSTATATTNSTPTPTVTFIYVPGLTDVVIGNMCLGMRKRNVQNLDLLTYDGPSKKAARRRAAGCVTGYCNYKQTGKTCDEYPFASTQQGGPGAQIGCVPAYQNNEQGTVLNTFRIENNLQPGQVFGVLIQGINCNDVVSIAPPERRSDNEVTGFGYNATVLPPVSGGNSTLNHVLLPLGDLAAGSYSVSSLGSTNMNSLWILDGDGEQYGQLTNLAPDDNQTVNIAIPDTEELGVGMVIFTASQSLNITWYFNGTTNTVLASRGQEQQRSSLHFWGAFIILTLLISF